MEAIQLLPRARVEDDAALGKACAICGQAALAVVHLDRLPDYIRCSSCASVFILAQDSDLVMYGSIPANYPATRQFALKRWLALPVIQAKATAEWGLPAGETPADGALVGADLPFGPTANGSAEEPTPALGITAGGQKNGGAERASPAPFGVGTFNDFLSKQPAATPDASNTSAAGSELEHASAEPDPGQRFNVQLRAEMASVPADLCAHCLRQPAEMGLVVVGPQPKQTRYQVPLCEDCRRRVRARSDVEKSSRLTVHLGSVAIGMILMVGALALGLLDNLQDALPSVLVLGALGVIGYALPAFLLLGAASRLPPPADAIFVRSTLRVQAGEDGTVTSFLWRNRGYAARFAAANGVEDIAQVVEAEETKPPASDPMTLR